MTKEEKLAGNRIIGEFMGKSFSMSHILDYKGVSDEALPTMKYHSDWKWLMPAWYKVRDIRTSDYGSQFEHQDIKQNCVYAICYKDIESAFHEIVNAIKWYNTKQLNK